MKNATLRESTHTWRYPLFLLWLLLPHRVVALSFPFVNDGLVYPMLKEVRKETLKHLSSAYREVDQQRKCLNVRMWGKTHWTTVWCFTTCWNHFRREWLNNPLVKATWQEEIADVFTFMVECNCLCPTEREKSGVKVAASPIVYFAYDGANLHSGAVRMSALLPDPTQVLYTVCSIYPRIKRRRQSKQCGDLPPLWDWKKVEAGMRAIFTTSTRWGWLYSL